MTKTLIILIVGLSGWKSTLPGRRKNPSLPHFVPVLKYELHSSRIRKWQIHGHNYIVLLICWGAHYRKPRVAWKTANKASRACRGGSWQCLTVLGKHREGVSLPWSPWRLHCVCILIGLCFDTHTQSEPASWPRPQVTLRIPPRMEGGGGGRHRKEQPLTKHCHVTFLL